MTIPLVADDGTMTAELAQFDLAHEMAEFEHYKRGPKGSIPRLSSKRRIFGLF